MSCAVCGADGDGPRHHVFLGPSTAWHHQAVGCSGRLNCPICAGNLLAEVRLEQLGMVALNAAEIDDEVARLQDQILGPAGVPPLLFAPKVSAPGDLLLDGSFRRGMSPSEADQWVRTQRASYCGLPPRIRPERRRGWRLRGRPMDAKAWADIALIGAVGDAAVLDLSGHLPGPPLLAMLITAGIMLPAFYRRATLTTRRTT